MIIDNIHKGYSTFDQKIPPIQKKIEEFLGDALFENDRALRIEQGCYSRQLRYHHKLYKKNGVPIIIVYIGETDHKWFSDIEIYIDDSNRFLEVKKIVEKIREVMWQYPHVSDKKTEYQHYVDYESCPICGNSFDKKGIGSSVYAPYDPFVCGNCGWDARKAKTIKTPNQEEKPDEKGKHRNNWFKKDTNKK